MVLKNLGQVIDQAKDVEFLLGNLLPKGAISALVGSSETGKTQLALQIAASIAAGEDEFLGLKLNTKNRRVLVIPTEDSEPVIKMRFEALVKQFGEQIRDNIYFGFDVIENPIRDIHERSKEVPFELLIVDTFMDFFHEDLNRGTEVRAFFDEYKRLAEELNCAVLFIHHFNKAGDGRSVSKKNILGSQSIEAKMRSVLALEYSNTTGLRTLKFLKGNLVPESVKRGFELKLTLDKNFVFKVAGTTTEEQTDSESKRSVVSKILESNQLWETPLRTLSKLLKEKYHLDVGKTFLAELKKMHNQRNKQM